MKFVRLGNRQIMEQADHENRQIMKKGNIAYKMVSKFYCYTWDKAK